MPTRKFYSSPPAASADAPGPARAKFTASRKGHIHPKLARISNPIQRDSPFSKKFLMAKSNMQFESSFALTTLPPPLLQQLHASLAMLLVLHNRNRRQLHCKILNNLRNYPANIVV